MRLLFVVTALFVCAVFAGCSNSDQPASEKTSPQSVVPTGQLPETVQPLAYTLHFTMNPDKAAFTAHEVIIVELKQPVHTIWFDGKGIDVTRAQLVLENGKTLKVGYKQMNSDGVAQLSLPETVAPQQARIVLDFSNAYSTGLAGAYKVNAEGNDYIFTQFEAIAARRAFPCFDEPAFKTPFTISFTVPKGDKVVANTPVASKANASHDRVTWRFMTTKPLPTYLVAWAVGPLDIVTGPSIPANAIRAHAVPVQGVTIKGKGHLIRYAIKHVSAIVTTEEKYFGMAYPWRKVALIAVPEFAAGAMENPGAVTFRGRYILFNPATAPTSQKQRYWRVTAHEMAHMWTGDLVTVPWWNDIWLNEAFATWQAQKVMETLHPEWHPKLDAMAANLYAMDADSLVSAREIRQPIKTTADIKTAFDAITYEKGAAVIRMFENAVGADPFRRGMHQYLEQNAYGSGSLDGFLAAISKAAGKNIAPAFKTFLNQPGLPMVSVRLSITNGQPTIDLVQRRYLPLGSKGDPHGERWDIPVCLHYPVDGKVRQQCVMLDQRRMTVPLETKTRPAWVMPNANGAGYYQWSLGSVGYRLLAQSFNQLSPAGQMSYVASIESQYKAGRLKIGAVMAALAPLAKSKNYPVAEAPMGPVELAHDWLTNGKAREGVEAYAHQLYQGEKVAADFTRDGAPKQADKRQFEAAVARFLAVAGDDARIRKAADQAASRLLGLAPQLQPNFTAIAPEFIPLALMLAVQDQGKPVFEALNRVFRHTQDPLVRHATLVAMTTTPNAALAAKLRDWTLDPKIIKQNEIETILFAQLARSATREAAWLWIHKHYKAVAKRLPNAFGDVLPRAIGYFCGDKQADKMAAFFRGQATHSAGAERRLTQAVERAHLCAARRDAQKAAAKAFFSQFAPE